MSEKDLSLDDFLRTLLFVVISIFILFFILLILINTNFPEEFTRKLGMFCGKYYKEFMQGFYSIK